VDGCRSPPAMTTPLQFRVDASASARSSRDWYVTVGLAVSALSAAASSFASLRSLALAAGWPVWLAPLLPLTIDAYGMTATRVWLAGSTGSTRARRFARANAVGAIGMSLAGNASYHLIAVQLVAVSWMVVVAVGAVPALVLGLVAHLAVLRNQIDGFRWSREIRSVLHLSETPGLPGDSPDPGQHGRPYRVHPGGRSRSCLRRRARPTGPTEPRMAAVSPATRCGRNSGSAGRGRRHCCGRSGRSHRERRARHEPRARRRLRLVCFACAISGGWLELFTGNGHRYRAISR
jgi:uncharacterized protein DUF2637